MSARIGLRPRLALSHALLALALVVVASVILEHQSERLRRSEAAAGVERDAEVAAQRAARVISRAGRLDRVVADERSGHRSIEIIDAEDHLLAGSVPPSTGAAAGRAAADALDGLTSGRAVRRQRYALGAAPILQGDAVVGAAVLVEEASGSQPWTVPTGLALLPGLVLVLAAASAGWVVAGHVAGPIEDLTRTARTLALGTLDVDSSTAGGGGPEVETLRAAVGRMVERTRSVAARSREREGDQASAVRRLSHQLRTPIAVLALRLDELASPDTTPARRDHLADVSRRQIDTITALSSNLEQLARGGVGGGTELIDIAALTRRVTGRLQPLARSARTRLEIGPSTGAVVLGDPAALDDAVANIVENAIKYTPAGGTVRVAMTSDDCETVVAVDDSGPGISPHERDLVVLPWVRGDAGTAAPGTGLGLSLAADAMSRAGGRVEIGDSPAGGARVRLVLPLATPPTPR